MLIQDLLIERDDLVGDVNRKDFFCQQDFSTIDDPG